MRNVAEAVLALAVVLVLGVAFFMFTGESLDGGEEGDAPTQATIDTEASVRGQAVAADAGCLACHTVDGTPGTGPTFKGLAGSSRPLASGETVIADDAYLTSSILDPAGEIVAGFDAVMPTTYSEQLTEDEISDLVEYIKSLG